MSSGSNFAWSDSLICAQRHQSRVLVLNVILLLPVKFVCLFFIVIVLKKYERFPTHQIPNLRGSEFKPEFVTDIAQNILSFLKSNATKVGHTYWLYKGMYTPLLMTKVLYCSTVVFHTRVCMPYPVVQLKQPFYSCMPFYSLVTSVYLLKNEVAYFTCKQLQKLNDG